MDDMTRFERQLADELDDMAGPGRDIDALEMTRVVSTRSSRWQLRSMFSATRVVLAGSLAALVLAYLVIGRAPSAPELQVVPGASASPSAPATVLPGLVTEEVEPGVLRIIRDDAGHDLDAGHPDWRLDLDGITITSDGTIWLRTSAHDEDNGVDQAGPPLWALGRPGGVTPPVWGGDPIPLADGTMLFPGDPGHVFDGTTFTPDNGATVRPVSGGMLWLLEPDDLMGLVPDGVTIKPPVGRLAVMWHVGDGRWSTVSEASQSARSGDHTCRPTSSGVSCIDDSRGNEVRYLRGNQINQVAVAPDGAIWAVGALDGQGGGLYRISLR